MAEIEAPPGVELTLNVVYGTGGGRPLRLHMLRSSVPLPAPAPVIVWIHGGMWRVGNKETGIAPLARWARRGFVCASIEYRFSSEALFPAQIEDCKCAVRFLRAHAIRFNLDPALMGVWGPSAGGHLAALLATTGGIPDFDGTGGWPAFSSRVQAVCDWYGPTDFLQMDGAPGPSAVRHDVAESPESELVGGPIRERQAAVARANPIRYISGAEPPFLIMHGDQDPMVPINQSELLYAALKRAGVDVTFLPVVGAGHGGPGFRDAAVDQAVAAFFTRTLGGETPEPR